MGQSHQLIDLICTDEHRTPTTHLFAIGGSTQVVANWLHCGYIPTLYKCKIAM